MWSEEQAIPRKQACGAGDVELVELTPEDAEDDR